MDTIEGLIVVEEPKIIRNKQFKNCIFKENNYFKATLENVVFENCDLQVCNFSRANLKNCKFIDCNMQFSGFSGIHIDACEFIRCDMSHGILTYSTILNTKFRKSNIEAVMKDTNWHDNDFDTNTIIVSCSGGCGLHLEQLEQILSEAFAYKE